jgi:hypothetical protein
VPTRSPSRQNGSGRRPVIQVRTDERIVVTGGTGTGKTTFVRKFLYPRIPVDHTVVVVDPKRDAIWCDLEDTGWSGKYLTDLKPGERSAFRFGGSITQQEETRGLAHNKRFDSFVEFCFRRGNILLIMDESATMFTGPYSMTPNMSRVIREGRQRGIGIWWLTQRPSNIPTIILTEAQCAAVFNLQYKGDRVKVGQAFGDQLEEKPDQTSDQDIPHKFWWVRNQAKPIVVELLLKPPRSERRAAKAEESEAYG